MVGSLVVTCSCRSGVADGVAAAAIIAFLIVGIQKIAQPQPECYAVIDGKVYTDQEFVHNEALDALEDVSADSEDPFSALDMMKQ